MEQTTQGMGGTNAQVRVGPDLVTWQDVSGSTNSVTMTEGRRATGEAYTFSGDLAIVTAGQREPIEVTIRALYTQALQEAWQRCRAYFEALGGARLYVRWRPNPLARWITTPKADVIRFNYPTADAGEAAPIAVEIAFRSREGLLPTWERFREVCGETLVGFWRLAELSGTVAHDASGWLRHGVHQGVVLGEASPVGLAALYEGAAETNVFSLNLAQAFGTEQGSLGIWLSIAEAEGVSPDDGRMAALFAADAENMVYILPRDGTVNVEAGVIVGGVAHTRVAPLGPSAWTFVMVTWDTVAGVVLYINGLEARRVAGPIGGWSTALSSARIGMREAGVVGATRPLRLACCLVCDEALSAAQVLELSLSD